MQQIEVSIRKLKRARLEEIKLVKEEDGLGFSLHLLCMLFHCLGGFQKHNFILPERDYISKIKISKQPTTINSSTDHFLPKPAAVHKISLKTDLAKHIAFGVKVFEWKYLEILQLPRLSRVYSDDRLGCHSLTVLLR